MEKSDKQLKKKFFQFLKPVLIFVFVFLLIAAPKTVKAGIFGSLIDFAAGAIAKMIAWVLLAVSYVMGFLLGWAGNLFDYIITAGTKYPPAIHYGWELSLGITNIIFVFGLLFIGFATIYRIGGYGYKELLTKFIIIALLINFSFFFGDLLFQLSNDLAKPFILKAGEIHSAVNIQDIHKPPSEKEKIIKQKEKSGVEALFDTIVALLFQIVFMLVMLFITLAYAFFFLVRLIAIWVLLVLAPFAWAFMIFPRTKSYASEWWNSFIKYCFFAPAALFFWYLSIKMKGFFDNAIINSAIDTTSAELGVSSITNNILTALIIAGFATAGLIVAQKLGIHGAAEVQRAWKSYKGRIQPYKTRTPEEWGKMLGTGVVRTGAALGVRPYQRIVEKEKLEKTKEKERSKEAAVKNAESYRATMSDEEKLKFLKKKPKTTEGKILQATLMKEMRERKTPFAAKAAETLGGAENVKRFTNLSKNVGDAEKLYKEKFEERQKGKISLEELRTAENMRREAYDNYSKFFKTAKKARKYKKTGIAAATTEEEFGKYINKKSKSLSDQIKEMEEKIKKEERAAAAPKPEEPRA